MQRFSPMIDLSQHFPQRLGLLLGCFRNFSCSIPSLFLSQTTKRYKTDVNEPCLNNRCSWHTKRWWIQTWIALLGRRATSLRPSNRATYSSDALHEHNKRSIISISWIFVFVVHTSLRIFLSPTPLGWLRSAISHRGISSKVLMTSSSRNGNLAWQKQDYKKWNVDLDTCKRFNRRILFIIHPPLCRGHLCICHLSLSFSSKFFACLASFLHEAQANYIETLQTRKNG